MSLTSPVPDPDSGIAFTALGQKCFYCGCEVSDPAIHWIGFDAEIYLHDRCVDELFVRFSRDRHELRCPAYYTKLRARSSSL